MASELFGSIGGVVRAFGGDLNTVRVSPNLMTGEAELDAFLSGMVTYQG